MLHQRPPHPLELYKQFLPPTLLLPRLLLVSSHQEFWEVGTGSTGHHFTLAFPRFCLVEVLSQKSCVASQITGDKCYSMTERPEGCLKWRFPHFVPTHQIAS